MALLDRLNDTLGLVATMRRAGLIAPLRPDKYLRMAAAMRRENISAISGFASAAQRCPDRPGLVDEVGTLTWRQIDQRCDALAAALQALPGGQPAPPRRVLLLSAEDDLVDTIRPRIDAAGGDPRRIVATAFTPVRASKT